MNKKEKPPVICRICKQEYCVPCGKFAEIDYKTRTGVCKGCASREKKRSEKPTPNIFTRNQADVDIVNEVYWGDCYGLRAMKRQGMEFKTIVDVGANIGSFSVLAHELWPNARIIAIEPNTGTFSVLQHNAPWAELYNVAVGERAGEANLIVAAGQPGSSFVADNNWQQTAEWKTRADNRTYSPAGKVRCDVFEHVLKQASLEGNIDLLKLDCEGGEFPLLHSLSKDAAARIRRVVGEYHHPDGFDAFAGVARKALPHIRITGCNPGAIGPFWGSENSPNVIECYHSASGIGDAVCAVYAAAGLAATGQRVRLYSKQAHWLGRASYPGLEIVTSEDKAGIDLYAGYGESLSTGTCRKQWYADNLARGAGIEKFTPVAPHIDSTIHVPRTGSENYIILSPFSAWRGREWPSSHWTRLSYLLADAGFNIVAIDGVGDGERLRTLFQHTPTKWFWGMPPEWVTDAMLGAHAVIGNDSGMTHLAGMLGVKTIAVHAQVSAQQLWGFTDIISVTSQDAPCIGCGWQGSRGWRKACDAACSALYSISTTQVLDALTGTNINV